MADLRFLDLHVHALFTHDDRGRIRDVNTPGGRRAPRFYFGRSAEANLWRCRYDLAPATMREIDALAAAEPVQVDLQAPPTRLAAILHALHEDAPGAAITAGPAYRFPALLPNPEVTTMRLSRGDLHLLRLMDWDVAETARDFESYEPFVAVVQNGAAVSLCHSSRLTSLAAEAGAETVAAYRGRRYASAAVAGWATLIRESGREPLYSTSWQNHASQAVARSLGLVCFGSDFSVN